MVGPVDRGPLGGRRDASSTVVTVERSGTSGRWSHRPYLDGLRALAIYLVVGFHAGVPWLRSGYLGVDIFFVLSGYLVTAILLVELDRDDRIDLVRFYGRRVRRLLPAACLVLVVSAAAYPLVGAEVPDLESSAFGSAALYHANWFYNDHVLAYWNPASGGTVLPHFWSLAVEEQFYFVWPLLLFGLVRASAKAGRHRAAAVRAAVAAIGAASLYWAWHVAQTDPFRAYYGTDTRAYQLMAGAVLAASPGALRRLRGFVSDGQASVGAVLMIVGLIVLSGRTFDLDLRVRLMATVVTLVLVVSLETRPGSAVARAFSWRPLTLLGRLSYGTYLWHWLVMEAVRRVTLDPTVVVLTTSVVATAVSALSYRFVEAPIRRADLPERAKVAVIAVGVGASALVGLVVAPLLLSL